MQREDRPPLTPEVLKLDCEAEVERIAAGMVQIIGERLGRLHRPAAVRAAQHPALVHHDVALHPPAAPAPADRDDRARHDDAAAAPEQVAGVAVSGAVRAVAADGADHAVLHGDARARRADPSRAGAPAGVQGDGEGVTGSHGSSQ